MAINFPSSPTNGQVYTDSTSGLTWVYSTTSTAWSASFNRSNYVSQTFTATAGQTSFTVSGGYLPTLVEVYQNGVLLVNGTDVTVTSGTTVNLAVGAVAGDIIQVIGNSTFNIANVDAGNITSGTLAVARGGTGLSSPGTSGNVLTSDGTNWTSAAPASTGIDVQTFTSSGTWTKPSRSASSRVLIQAWGGGGSGAKNTTNAGGGGGGGYNERWVTLSTMGATETITIGAGGTAITAATTVGNNGGNTTVGSLITAYGGGGGGTAAPGNVNGGGGGGQLSAGTNGNTVGSSGSVGSPGLPIYGFSTDPGNYMKTQGSGGAGGFDQGTSSFQHGGGGASHASVWGGGGGGYGNASPGAGGASSFGGAGGAGSNSTTATSGTQPGGGGGGTVSGTSGAGGAGQVIITVFRRKE